MKGALYVHLSISFWWLGLFMKFTCHLKEHDGLSETILTFRNNEAKP